MHPQIYHPKKPYFLEYNGLEVRKHMLADQRKLTKLKWKWQAVTIFEVHEKRIAFDGVTQNYKMLLYMMGKWKF